MEDIDTIKYKLGKLGYSLFELDEDINIEKLFMDLIKLKDLRYIKSIPFILFQHQDFNLSALLELAKKNSITKEINLLLYISNIIFKKQGLDNSLLIKYLREYLTKKEISQFKRLERRILDKKLERLSFKISNTFFDEVYNDFLMHKTSFELEKKSKIIEQISKSKELETQFALSKLFKRKQKEIISKILNEKELTKTEYEYYIRIIKKRLDAIIQLKDIAQIVIRKKTKKKK